MLQTAVDVIDQFQTLQCFVRDLLSQNIRLTLPAVKPMSLSDYTL